MKNIGKLNIGKLNKELIKAVKKGDPKQVDFLLQQGADVNYLNYSETPLMITASKGNFQVAKTLLDNKADPALFSFNHRTSGILSSQTSALNIAINNGHYGIAHLILDQYDSKKLNLYPEQYQYWDLTVLRIALRNATDTNLIMKMIEKLIEASPDQRFILPDDVRFQDGFNLIKNSENYAKKIVQETKSTDSETQEKIDQKIKRVSGYIKSIGSVIILMNPKDTKRSKMAVQELQNLVKEIDHAGDGETLPEIFKLSLLTIFAVNNKDPMLLSFLYDHGLVDLESKDRSGKTVVELNDDKDKKRRGSLLMTEKAKARASTSEMFRAIQETNNPETLNNIVQLLSEKITIPDLVKIVVEYYKNHDFKKNQDEDKDKVKLIKNPTAKKLDKDKEKTKE